MENVDSFDPERIFSFIIDSVLLKPKDALSGWKELELINKIKNSLLDTLTGFAPNLPKQYACQFQSYSDKMRENNDFLRDWEHFLDFLNLYKIQLLDLSAKMDEKPNNLREQLTKTKDEYAPIKKKIENYYSMIERIYESMKTNWIENINLESFNEFCKMFIEDSQKQVERMDIDKPLEEA